MTTTFDTQRTNAMTAELIATCGTCGTAVEPGAGSVWVSPGVAFDYLADSKDWTERRSAALAEARTDGEAWAAEQKWKSKPELVEWRIDHYDCDPAARTGYPIDVGRINTWQKLCWWAGQIAGKEWASGTDWAILIQGAAAAVDADLRLRPINGHSVWPI